MNGNLLLINEAMSRDKYGETRRQKFGDAKSVVGWLDIFPHLIQHFTCLLEHRRKEGQP